MPVAAPRTFSFDEWVRDLEARGITVTIYPSRVARCGALTPTYIYLGLAVPVEKTDDVSDDEAMTCCLPVVRTLRRVVDSLRRRFRAAVAIPATTLKNVQTAKSVKKGCG